MYGNIICFFSFFISRNVRMVRVRKSRRWVKCTHTRVTVRFFWDASLPLYFVVPGLKSSPFYIIFLTDSSVYRDLPHWRSNQRPYNAEPTIYHWAIDSHRTQAMPNQLVMEIAQPINLNVSCKLHPYALQRIRSPPGPRLSKKINYYNLKGKEIDVHFLFLSIGVIV